MRYSCLFLSLLALCAFSFGMHPDDRPPAVAKIFTTNFTIQAADLSANPTTFGGFFAFNDKTGAGRLEFGGVEYIPLYLASTVITDPGAALIRGYWFADPVCWVDSVDASYLHLFPLEIPATANFTGNVTYNGVLCSVWQWDAPRVGPVEFFVDVSEYNPLGQPLAKIVFGPFVFTGEVVMKFTNFQVGPFSSSLNQPPSLQCIPPPFLEALPEGTKLNYFKKMTNMLVGFDLFME